MNPPENQNQNGQPQPQPNASVTPPGPAGSNGAVPTSQPEQSSSPQAIYAGSMLSREEAEKQRKLEDKAEKKKKLRKLILITLPILAAIIAVGALVYMGTIPLMKFRTVTYDNGNGQQFKLKFYSKHHFGDPPPFCDPPSCQTSKFLYADKGLNSKAPLVIGIAESSDSSTRNAYETNKNCGSLEKPFKVHLAYLNQDFNVCAFSEEGINVLDYVTFKDGSNVYVVTILQDINLSPATTQERIESLAKIDLGPYKEDIKTIVGSIKPL